MGKKIDDGKLQRRFNLISTIDAILFMYIERALLLVCLFICYFPPTRNVASKHAGKEFMHRSPCFKSNLNLKW